MEQHTAKRLRYSFLFLLPAVVLLIFVIFAQSQIIFGQAEDIIGETPKEIITPCENNELAALGANGLRCKSVKTRTTITTRGLDVISNNCQFGIKDFIVVPNSSTLSYTCVTPTVCGVNQFLSVQAGPTFTCIDHNFPNAKDQSCAVGYAISGFEEEGVPICTPSTNPLAGISCPDGQYLRGATTHALYMVGQSSDSLYVLDTTGRIQPRRIGQPFGGQEDEPLSITSHNGKLYMIGSSSNFLYELDTTGRRAARRIENLGGRIPQSITSHNGKLYMVGQSSDSLYELDTTGGRLPRRIGESFGGTENTPISITSHNGKLYMVGRGSTSLYELDTTGRKPARRIGESFVRQENVPRSITSHNGKLYMTGIGSHSLHELDTEATGKSPATRIGGSFVRQEPAPRSITSHNGKLYMIGSSSHSLYELDTTGIRPARKIGQPFGLENTPYSIVSHSRGTEAICEDF